MFQKWCNRCNTPLKASKIKALAVTQSVTLGTKTGVTMAKRGVTMTDINSKIPSPAEVRQIFNDTYNVFYKKWINPDTPYDPAMLLQEARELNRKYEGQKIVNITELIVCIEEERRLRNVNKEPR